MRKGRVVIRSATLRDAVGLAVVYRHAFGPGTAAGVRRAGARDPADAGGDPPDSGPRDLEHDPVHGPPTPRDPDLSEARIFGDLGLARPVRHPAARGMDREAVRVAEPLDAADARGSRDPSYLEEAG